MQIRHRKQWFTGKMIAQVRNGPHEKWVDASGFECNEALFTLSRTNFEKGYKRGFDTSAINDVRRIKNLQETVARLYKQLAECKRAPQPTSQKADHATTAVSGKTANQIIVDELSAADKEFITHRTIDISMLSLLASDYHKWWAEFLNASLSKSTVSRKDRSLRVLDPESGLNANIPRQFFDNRGCLKVASALQLTPPTESRKNEDRK